MNRRKFIGQAGCAALGYSTLLSSLINLKFLNAAAGSTLLGGDRDDYKALVCVMLSGGNDAFNMLMPTGQSAYQHYATTRSNLAIPELDILNLTQQNSINPDLGVHPSMPGLRDLFNDGKMAFLANTGMLVQPTTKSDFYNDNNLPLGLFSHSDQTFQWQTASPHERQTKGWGGKIADLIHNMNLQNGISMNISLAGTNVFQLGNETIEYSLNPYNGATGISGYQPNNPWNEFDNVRTAALDNMIDHDYQNIFEKTYVDVIRNSRNAHQVFQSALESGQEIQTQFSDNYLSQSFKMAARTMSIRDAIGVKRQIFFINFGGWDHHDELLGNQADMLFALNNALTEFQASLEELEIDSQVTTFGISEFGRTLTSNGNGTDHAWGSNVFMMGNHINGAKVYGKYPSLELGNPLEIGNGVLIPTTSADEYFAELALWFGVSRADLPLIFPNLSNFYDVQSTDLPLGFLNI